MNGFPANIIRCDVGLAGKIGLDCGEISLIQGYSCSNLKNPSSKGFFLVFYTPGKLQFCLIKI
jgi:hypothetical protein